VAPETPATTSIIAMRSLKRKLMQPADRYT
jgi:hypothetical protein